jgi:hypothetical protein
MSAMQDLERVDISGNWLHRPDRLRKIRGESLAVHGVHESLRDSFAHQNASRSEDGDEADNWDSLYARSHGWIFHAKALTFM